MAATTQRVRRVLRWGPESVPGRIWQALARPDADSLRGMYSHVFTPWRWGGFWAGAVAAQEAATAATGGADLASLALVAAGSTLTGQALASAAPTRLGERLAPHTAAWVRRERGHARIAAAAGALGATAVHALGWVGHSADSLALAAAAGVVGVAATGARYWQHHRHHTRVHRGGRAAAATSTETAPQAAERLAPDVYGRLLQRWPAVSGRGGVLEGAELVEPRRAPYGAVARVQLVPGRQDLAGVRAQLGRIASALRIHASQLDFTPDDPVEGEPDPTLLHLRVVATQTMRRPVPLDDGQPRLVVDELGRTLVRVGRYVDGDGEVYWLVYDGSSMWPGYIGGVTGSGKSSLSDALFLGLLETGCTYVVYLDPKGGQSSPRIAANCHWFIGDDPDRWRRVAAGLIAVIHARGRLLAHHGTSGFRPSPALPGISVIIDEAYEMAKVPGLVDDLAWIARKGRSVGVALTLLTQGYGLDDFGGSDALRSNTGVVNAFSLKLKANQGSIFARDFPDLPNPAHLPETEGQPHNKGLAVALRGRAAVLRTAWSPAPATDTLMAAAREATIDDLDPYTADALDEGSGGMFARRHADAEAAAAASAAEIAERTRRGQALLRGHPVRPATGAATGNGTGETAPATADTAAGRALPPALPERVLVDLDAWRRGERSPATGAAEAVLDVLGSAPDGLGTQQIIQALAGRPGCGSTAVKTALRHLHQTGRITKGTSRKDPWHLANSN